MDSNKNARPSAQGRFGRYGGQYVPETLMPALSELEQAAKEAFSKAIGIGISRGINFDEITVYNIKSGKPGIKLLGNTKKIVNKILNKKKINIFLSLSDDKPFAVATVVISI